MIHWQYIKSAYNQPSSGTSNNTILYTFIDYYGGITIPNTLTQSMLPTIEICNNTDRNASGAIRKPAGHIMVSGIAQTFDARMTFTTGIYTDEIKDRTGTHKSMLTRSSYYDYLYLGSGFEEIRIGDTSSCKTTIAGQCVVNQYIKIGEATASPTRGHLSAEAIYSDGICQAQYFNATSDRRAKTDIKPINQSVLPLVINTQLYSFKYKDLDTPSIGIIAQDVQDVDFDGFSLVDNKEATGQDMDYMSIHESKLIYVLWKAVQEQQKEIEELKTQIKKGL